MSAQAPDSPAKLPEAFDAEWASAKYDTYANVKPDQARYWFERGVSYGELAAPLPAAPAPDSNECTLCNGMGIIDGLGELCPHCNGEGLEPVAALPAEQALTTQTVDDLLYEHARAVIGCHEHGETGGFYTDLKSAENDIRAALAARQAPTDNWIAIADQPPPFNTQILVRGGSVAYDGCSNDHVETAHWWKGDAGIICEINSDRRIPSDAYDTPTHWMFPPSFGSAARQVVAPDELTMGTPEGSRVYSKGYASGRKKGLADAIAARQVDGAVERDAARYRWLRDKSDPGICAFYLSVGKAFDGVKFTQATVDEAIDAQIAQEKAS